MDTYNSAVTYTTALVLPSWAPPAWLFWPVWSVLYIMIIISYGAVVKTQIIDPIRVGQGVTSANLLFILPFVINVIANILFTYFQFGLKNYSLALVDILIVLVTIIWTMYLLWSSHKVLFWMQVPYLLWVSFATVLMWSVWGMN